MIGKYKVVPITFPQDSGRELSPEELDIGAIIYEPSAGLGEVLQGGASWVSALGPDFRATQRRASDVGTGSEISRDGVQHNTDSELGR